MSRKFRDYEDEYYDAYYGDESVESFSEKKRRKLESRKEQRRRKYDSYDEDLR